MSAYYVSVFAGVIDDSKLEVDFLISLLFGLSKLINWRKQYTWQKNPRISPSKLIWSTTVWNMPSSHSINRLFVFVDLIYASKLSPTLKYFMYVLFF